jgi:hypothetical protein
MNEPEKITLDQLAEGLKEVGYISGYSTSVDFGYVFRVSNPRAVAELIFRKFREPAYEINHVFRDSDGVPYCRLSGNQWRSCYSGVVVDHDYPKRPLRRLVPDDD